MLQGQIKIYASWILTVVMCYHIIGYAVLFGATDLVHRSGMKKLLSKKELAVLKISKGDIKHHPEIFIRLSKDEIFYAGNYYDVKKETTETDFTSFYVLKDVGENDWHQGLSEASSNSDANQSDGKTLKSGAKIFSPEWFSNFQLQFEPQYSSQPFLTFCDKNISNVSGEIFLPPPKV